MTAINAALFSQTEQSATKVTSNGNCNGTITTSPANTETTQTPDQPNFLVTILLTIYDVIIFLGISIGYIIQVSCTLFNHHSIPCSPLSKSVVDNFRCWIFFLP